MKNKKDKWFLGGTCAETTWREELIPLLEKEEIDYFNPVVDNWTTECQEIEELEKNYRCNVHLYVITPEMKGVYSIAEIIQSAHLANTYGTSVDKVVFVVLNSLKWTTGQLKSLDATMRLTKDIARENAIIGFVDNMDQLIKLYDE